jgi:two-component system sensor histidine kinase QseC
MKTSLKWRLLGWTAGGMVVLLGVFGVVIYTRVHRLLWEEFDDTLQGTAGLLAAFVKMEEGHVEMDFTEREMPEFSRGHKPAYFELWDGGAVVVRSPALGTGDLERLESRRGTGLPHTVTLPDGRPGRMVVLEFVPTEDPEVDNASGKSGHGADRPAAASHPLILAVARETKPLDTTMASVQKLLISTGAGCVVLMLVVASVVVRQGLRPVSALASRIAAIRENDLTDRVPTEALPVEMAPVGVRLNELLERLQAAFHRERTLTADVAHELRTPLAGMRSTMEVTLARPRPPEEYREALAECLEIIQQTQTVADNLLALARLEGGQAATQPETVRLAELVESLWRPHAVKARTRGLTWQNRLAAELEGKADVALLKIVLANLLANAAEYTNDGGRVEVSGRPVNGHVEVILANTGCTLPPEEASHVFERFWRGDAARGGTGVHCGLGLSLAERATAALGGTLSAEVADGLFTVRLVLPAA